MISINESIFVIAACAAGVVLGTMFYGGLWWTVRKGLAAEQPALWFFGSLMARMGGALTGFYFVSGGHWDRLLACLLGFVIARLVVSRLTQPARAIPIHQIQETEHAPQS